MPDGYGIDQATEFVAWAAVESKLREATHYWLSTVGPSGSPHVVPRWGVWLDGGFWYDGSPETRHVRNLDENPRCGLHLEDGAAATIVYGVSEPADSAAGDWGLRLSDEFSRKYAPTYAPQADAWSGDGAGGLRVLRPQSVLAWTGFPVDMTRFTFS
jgi:hypothetical protein